MTAHESRILLYALVAVNNNDLDWTLKQTQKAIEVMFQKKVSLPTLSRFRKAHEEDLSINQITHFSGKKAK